MGAGERHFRFAALGACLLGLGACVPMPPDDTGSNTLEFSNTTDPTNGGADFVGAAACGACHASIGESHRIHGHAQILKPIQGQPPLYPDGAGQAGVPNPPDGYEWSDIAFVIGGYLRKANFIDLQGRILTTGAHRVPAQWNLDQPVNGTIAGFVDFESSATDDLDYDPSCFTCHTTGSRPQDPAAPEFEDNRPGIAGTWAEPGVQCEACHGPGSNHVPHPERRDLFVDVSASACGTCHSRNEESAVISAADGYVESYQQHAELLASGGHAAFDCTLCHDPHVSSRFDQTNGIRNGCSTCHSDKNLALHEGFTFVRDVYLESLSCESCHMTFAVRGVTAAGEDIVGPVARMGDARTHIFRVNPSATRFTQMFTPDMTAVSEDSEGRAAVSLDFVCLRCHNGIGNAPAFTSESILSDVARNMHGTNSGSAKNVSTK